MTQPEIKERRGTEALRAPLLKDIGATTLLILAGRASVLGMFPFGMAFFASCFDKSIAYIGITALCAALMTTSGSYMLVKYLVAALVFWIYTRFGKERGIVADAAWCGGSMLVGSIVYLLYNFAGLYDILIIFIEAIVTSVMYIIFQKSKQLIKDRSKRARTAQDELISVSVSVGVMITGLSGIVFPYNIALSNIISVYAVLCISFYGSLAAAGSGGLCIGFLASMSSPSAVIMMGIFGISALFSNLLKAFGRFGAAIGFLGGTAVALLYASSNYALPVTIAETAIGALLFVVTPSKWRGALSAFFSTSLKLETLSSDVRVKQYLTMRLEKISDAFRSLEECFENASGKRLKTYGKDAASLLDEVSGRVCDSCPNAVRCWQSDFTRTYRNIMLLLDTIESKGTLTPSSVPTAFRDRCLRDDIFVTEFNHVYEMYKKNLVRVGEAVNGRDIVARQYGEISSLMRGMADEVAAGFTFREDMEENIVSELDKRGIIAFEVSVVEDGHGCMEVYLGVDKGVEVGAISRTLEEVLETPMAYRCDVAGGLMKFTSCARYEAEIAIRRVTRDFTDVSGDCIDSFSSDDYKHYVVISDGMGSGRRAMTESHITLKLLREFLLSGFGVRTSIDMINSVLCLKLDYECFSTIDLLCVDLMTGICEFYKIGGAESLVLHGADVETIFSVSLPAGMISDIKIQGQTKRLSSGDVIMMMTDGVSEAGFGAGGTNWIKKEIKTPFDTMEELAQSVIDAAVKKSRDSVLDDMTVAAVRLKEI